MKNKNLPKLRKKPQQNRIALRGGAYSLVITAVPAEPVKPDIHSLDFQYGATYSLRCGSVLGIMKASMPSLFNNARRASIR